jgi:lycopene cyclase domain-containing protein
VKGEYLMVLGFVLLFPLTFNFTLHLGLFRQWRALGGAILAATAVYGIWDVIVTARGHWQFNPTYILGPGFLGLPAEEWLFFLVIAFVSIFTHEAVKQRFSRRP